MSNRRIRSVVRKLGASLALVAMLAVALVPTLARAMADAPLAVEVCTVEGIRVVHVPASAPVDAAVLDHCPLCVLQAGGFPPPAFAILPIALPSAARIEPPAFLLAPRPLHAWTAAAPRAPPAA